MHERLSVDGSCGGVCSAPSFSLFPLGAFFDTFPLDAIFVTFSVGCNLPIGALIKPAAEGEIC